MAVDVNIRETVRRRYATAAEQAAQGEFEQARKTESESASCGAGGGCGDAVFGAALYGDEASEAVPAAAVEASLGCGVPTAVADLHEGETVLDLGSGAGADVLISARRVGPSGRVIGLDMTDEMLALARANATAAGVENVEFVKGYIEDMPLADESVDVVISNCVINLSADKPRVLREAARVLKPGGRFAVSDVIADPDMDDATRTGHAAMDGLHRRCAHPRRLRGARLPRPAWRRSRSSKRIACTSTPARRSSAPASPAPQPRGAATSIRPLRAARMRP